MVFFLGGGGGGGGQLPQICSSLGISPIGNSLASQDVVTPKLDPYVKMILTCLYLVAFLYKAFNLVQN